MGFALKTYMAYNNLPYSTVLACEERTMFLAIVITVRLLVQNFGDFCLSDASSDVSIRYSKLSNDVRKL